MPSIAAMTTTGVTIAMAQQEQIVNTHPTDTPRARKRVQSADCLRPP